MKARRRVLDAAAITFQTDMAVSAAEQTINAVRAYETDEHRSKRLEVAECKFCYYMRRGRIGGAAMTEWACGVCAEPGLHMSTAVPSVCIDCAKSHSLCSYCGGDLDMRVRRRKFPTPVKEEV